MTRFPDQPIRPAKAQLRASLRWTMVSVLPGGVFWAISLGACFPLLARAAGLNDRWFGVAAAIPAAAVLLQIPAASFIQRLGSRRGVMVGTGLVHRLLWILLAAVPLLFGKEGLGPVSVGAFLLIFVSIHASGSLSGLAWQTWMADLIPARRRGAFFGKRSRLFHISMLLVSLALALVLPWQSRLDEPAWLLLVLFAAAALFGAYEIQGYRGVADIPWRPAPRRVSLLSVLEPLRDRAFRPVVWFAMTIAAANAILGPFLWKHFLVSQQMSEMKVTLLLQAAPILAVIIVGPRWGLALDRHGKKPALLLAVTCGAAVTVCWMFITPQWWWAGLGVAILAQMFWTGVDMALFNLLLDYAATHRSRNSGPAYATCFNVAVALSALAAGIAGGEIAQQLQQAEWVDRVAERFEPFIFSPYLVLLMLNITLRLSAVGLFLPWMPRESEVRTVHAVRIMTGQIYASFVQHLARPWQGLMRRPTFEELAEPEPRRFMRRQLRR